MGDWRPEAGEGYTPAQAGQYLGRTQVGGFTGATGQLPQYQEYYRPGQREQFDLGEFAGERGFAPTTPTGGAMPGQNYESWANFIQQQYGIEPREFLGMGGQERYGAWAEEQGLAVTPEQVPVDEMGMPTRPPGSPQEAALFQFVGERAAMQKNQELLEQSITAIEQGRQMQVQEDVRARTEAGEAIEAGRARQEEEVRMTRGENRRLMEQSIGVMRYALGLLRKGGAGSLAAFQQPHFQQMAQTYMAGREAPYDFTQSYRDLASIAGTRTDYAQFAGQQAQVYHQSQYSAQDFSYFLMPMAYGG